MVFPAESTVTIEVVRPKRAVIVIDGHYRRDIEAKKTRVTISRSENVSSFVRFRGDFYHRLKGRLLYPRRERS